MTRIPPYGLVCVLVLTVSGCSAGDGSAEAERVQHATRQLRTYLAGVEDVLERDNISSDIREAAERWRETLKEGLALIEDGSLGDTVLLMRADLVHRHGETINYVIQVFYLDAVNQVASLKLEDEDGRYAYFDVQGEAACNAENSIFFNFLIPLQSDETLGQPRPTARATYYLPPELVGRKLSLRLRLNNAAETQAVPVLYREHGPESRPFAPSDNLQDRSVSGCPA